jgi:competence protein ComEA
MTDVRTFRGVREAKNPEDVVRARLRTVVAGPVMGATPAMDFSDLSPLSWTDIVPSWPEPDLDDQTPPAPASSAPAARSHAPTRSGEAGALPAGQPEAHAAAPPSPETTMSGPLSTPAQPARYPWDPPDRLDPGSLALESMGLEPLASPSPPAPVPTGIRRRVAGRDDTPGQTAAEMGMPEWTYADDSAVTGAGAFDPPGVDGSWLARLLPFDPGRRGVKALGAVAVVVVLIAAFLAWHARPKVDPVAEPPVPTGTDGETAPSPRTSSAGEVVVAVGGKVRKPGLVHLPPGSRVADALTAAGGAQPGTDVTALNLARKVVDGELIMVGAAAPAGGSGASTTSTGGGLLNLNTASLADLDKLPGVGPVLAQRILDARDAQGGFRAVSDLRKVDGIGDSRYEQLKDLVTV